MTAIVDAKEITVGEGVIVDEKVVAEEVERNNDLSKVEPKTFMIFLRIRMARFDMSVVC